MQLVVLDGLRAIFLHLDRADLAELTCGLYDAWTGAMGDDFRFIPGASQQLQDNFAHTRGFLRGRALELAIQLAVEEARRKVVLSDPDAFATQVADTVAAHVGPVPVATRTRIEDELRDRLGASWVRPPDAVREQVVEAEWLRGLIEVHDGRDYTPVVVFFGKALESLLQYLSQSDAILSEFRRQLLAPVIKVRWLRRGAPQQIIDRLVAAIDLRNPAAHGQAGPYRPIPRSRATKMRELVIGSEAQEGLITLLNDHAKWP